MRPKGQGLCPGLYLVNASPPGTKSSWASGKGTAAGHRALSVERKPVILTPKVQIAANNALQSSSTHKVGHRALFSGTVSCNKFRDWSFSPNSLQHGLYEGAHEAPGKSAMSRRLYIPEVRSSDQQCQSPKHCSFPRSHGISCAQMTSAHSQLLEHHSTAHVLHGSSSSSSTHTFQATDCRRHCRSPQNNSGIYNPSAYRRHGSAVPEAF